MGCDIHALIEWPGKGPTLQVVAEINLPRDYDLFGLMADVRTRDDVTPLFQARGMPDDLSHEARYRYEKWGDDAHTPSWLSPGDLSRVADAYRAHPRCWSDTVQVLDGIVALMRALGVAKPPRLLFWFDN